MPKNILIFADGTGQVGGIRPDQQLSNIYKLFRATRIGPDSEINPNEQVAFYDPGLGTTNASGSVRFKLWRTIKSLGGLALGLGFSENVIDCYEAILKRYEPGDRIYLFGFSRGGYTVRAVANVLNVCGVPTLDGKGNPLPRSGLRLREIATEAVKEVYEHGAGRSRDAYEKQREEIGRRFRAKYGAGSDPDRGDVFPYFVGVFDAVAALGMSPRARLLIGSIAFATAAGLGIIGGLIAQWLLGWSVVYVVAGAVGLAVVAAIAGYGYTTFRWTPKVVREAKDIGGPAFHFALWNSKNYDQYLDPRIPLVRHAVAIDETRKQFARVKWGGSKNVDHPGSSRPHFMQRWFSGNHSDIGGSYPEEESRLSDIALGWMLHEATQEPHPILWDEKKLRLFPDPTAPQHSEIFAKKNGSWWGRWPGWPVEIREMPKIATLDDSVFVRFAAESVLDCDRRSKYRPESLKHHEKLRSYYLEHAKDEGVQ